MPWQNDENTHANVSVLFVDYAWIVQGIELKEKFGINQNWESEVILWMWCEEGKETKR